MVRRVYILQRAGWIVVQAVPEEHGHSGHGVFNTDVKGSSHRQGSGFGPSCGPLNATGLLCSS